MHLIEYRGITVDRCSKCKGLWFDMLEHEHLKAIEGSESIDPEGPREAEGKQSALPKDDRIPIDCPVCKRPLIRMVDREQPHIWVEGCATCYGIFFDAGEFRDFKEKTVLDFFRDLRAKERR
jgi:Zn-finger nucleic acid-binding protein